MKKTLCLCILFFHIGIAIAFAKPSVAVIDFIIDDYCPSHSKNSTLLTDLFRNPLTQSGKASIVDRKQLDQIKKELKFQGDWADPEKAKKIGKMFGADYLITGKFDMLGEKLYLVAQMMDLETGVLIHSSSMSLYNCEEYENKVGDFAKEFINKFNEETNSFIGTWKSVVVHGDIKDIYTITFSEKGRCVIELTSIKFGKEITEKSSEGLYSYKGERLKITAFFKNSKISHVNAIEWERVIGEDDIGTSFKIDITPSNKSEKKEKVTFNKID